MPSKLVWRDGKMEIRAAADDANARVACARVGNIVPPTGELNLIWRKSPATETLLRYAGDELANFIAGEPMDAMRAELVAMLPDLRPLGTAQAMSLADATTDAEINDEAIMSPNDSPTRRIELLTKLNQRGH